MTTSVRNVGLFVVVACLIAGTGFIQSWNTALFILNMGLISAIMSLGRSEEHTSELQSRE